MRPDTATHPPSPQRRALLQRSLAAGAAAALGLPALARPSAAGPDLSGVTLRIGTYKGLWRPLISAAGLANTPTASSGAS